MKSTSPKRGIGITIKIVLACSVFSALAVLGAVLTTYYLSIQSSVALAEEKVSGSRTLIKNQVEGLHRSYSETASKLGQSAILESVFKRYSSETELATARTLFLAAFQQSQCQGLTILDAQGNVLISEGSSLGSNDWKGDQYPVKNLINQALTGNTVEGTFWSSPNGPRESIYFYASPLMNTNGAGMIVCEFNSTRLVELMQFEGRPREASLGSTGEAYLLSDKRTALTPTRGGSNSALNSDAVSLSLQRSEGASVYNNYNGEKVVGAYTTVSAPSENWGLVLEQSYSEALGAGSNLIWMSLGVGLIFIIIVSLFSVVWANWFSRPVMSLDEAMRRVSAGDDEARAPVTSGDEIGLLADNFNQLVEERNTARDRITSDTKRLQNNIQELLLVVADASEGKLSVHAKKTEGVLGNVADALNRMFQNVGVLIGESKNASAQVEQAAAGIASYAEALTHGAAQQSEQVHHTIQDVETMTAEAQNISKNSKEAAQSATLTRQAAEKGANGVTETVQFMERLEESVQATAQKINDLGKRSEEISGIVQSISDISAETDVLAMNASIEAARAGEQGKGFTIVADQVRALADRTRLATVEIEKLVRGIQSETSEAVRQMDSQTQEVRNGVSQVISAGKELSNIVETSVDSSTLAGQISLSSTGQENRAQAVLNAVISINQVAEETRNRTVEFQQTSEQLAMLANELNKQLANFEVEESTSPQHTQSEV